MFLLIYHPFIGKGLADGWEPREIATVIHALIFESFGLPRGRYLDDTTFSEMGID
jgi:hypothetical protein